MTRAGDLIIRGQAVVQEALRRREGGGTGTTTNLRLTPENQEGGITRMIVMKILNLQGIKAVVAVTRML